MPLPRIQRAVRTHDRICPGHAQPTRPVPMSERGAGLHGLLVVDRAPTVRGRSSGRKTLYLASHASHIIGWPPEEGRRLIEELVAFATQPQFVYQHCWHVGDPTHLG